MMPTQSRVSMAGAFPLAWSLDHVGIFSRSVADIEILLETLGESSIPSRSRSDSHRFRIGIVSQYFPGKADAETQTKLRELNGHLTAAGFHLSDAPLPPIFDLHPAILRTIVRSEAAATHEHLLLSKPNAYGPKLRDLVQMGELIDASAYLRARRIRRHYQKEMLRLFEHCDVVLTPAAPGPAPEGIAATGHPVMQAPWTLADFPTMTLPFAVASNGLPLGIQLTAAPFHEGLLLEAAKAIEAAIAFKATPQL